ncbi:hypothetical protein DFH29DRAFT_879354 [Suillus ampliporus]|nr:hypothetical protein DFH29DRAFT_879354 [Suillus ampliporus]
MPQAQNPGSQPSNMIDGHATLLAAHAIFSTPRTHSDTSSTSSGSGEDDDQLMHSATSDSCNGSLDSLDLPLQAHMLPVLFTRDTCGGFVSLWLACAVRAQFCHLPRAIHFGVAESFQDIKGATSIEAVDSLTSLHWRSDLPDFKTQFGGHLEERVASWTHHVHVHTSSSESSSYTRRTPSPLSDPALVSYENMSSQNLAIIVEEEQCPSAAQGDTCDGGEDTRKGVATTVLEELITEVSFALITLAGLSDAGLVDVLTVSNWLFERMAFTVGRISLPKEPQHESAINEMVQTYDQMTAFAWSDQVQTILSDSTVDSSVLDVRSELLATDANLIRQSSTINIPLEDAQYISARLSALLHAVKGARDCEGVAKLHGANEIDRRHEWDALLLTFFQPVPGQRDVLLERELNFARNFAADDTSFVERAECLTAEYLAFCTSQRRTFLGTKQSDSVIVDQAIAALTQAAQFYSDIACRLDAAAKIAAHSRMEPNKGRCDAVLVVPCSGATSEMLQGIPNSKEREEFLSTFMLIRDSKPEKNDTNLAKGEPSSQVEKLVKGRSHKSTSDRQLQDPFVAHPDSTRPTNILPEQTSFPDPSKQDLLLPVLLSEYKRNDKSTISKATNQMRTYLVSAITFLSALGITNTPVFGLVVNGTRGAVTMAWKEEEKIYIMERNVRHYDITDPLQALQFVSVLLRLARHGQKLRCLFEGKLHMNISSKSLKPWSKFAQGDSKEDGESA